MGAWGSGPYDNDSAADWFFGLGEIGLYDLIERGLKDGGYNEQRAAAWLVQRLAISPYVYDVYLIDEHRELAVEKLKDILDDQDWLDSWRDPDETIAEIKQQIDEIEDSIASPGLIEQMRDLDDVPDKGVPNVEVAETLDDAVDVRNKRQQDYMRTDLSHLEQLAKADAKAREKALLEYRKTLRQRHTQGQRDLGGQQAIDRKFTRDPSRSLPGPPVEIFKEGDIKKREDMKRAREIDIELANGAAVDNAVEVLIGAPLPEDEPERCLEAVRRAERATQILTSADPDAPP